MPLRASDGNVICEASSQMLLVTRRDPLVGLTKSRTLSGGPRRSYRRGGGLGIAKDREHSGPDFDFVYLRRSMITASLLHCRSVSP